MAALAIGCLLTNSLPADDPPDRPARTSRHLTDAILEGYRKGSATPKPSTSESPAEVEPGIVVLPTMEVRGQHHGTALASEDLTVKSEAIPLVAGTGVTEIKGPHRTILIRRILFIPVGFKISW